MNELTIALKITDFELDHTFINNLLNLTSTNCYRKGEVYYVGPTHNRLQKEYKTNYWEFRVNIKENEVWVSTVVTQFVKEFIDARAEALETIKNKCQLEIYIGVFYNKEERLESFHFDIEMLKLLSRLNIEIDIDQQILE